MSNILIIDYGSGNLRSVNNAFLQVMKQSDEIKISDNPLLLDWASHVVLPGVGAFGDCMRELNARPGLREALERIVYQHAYVQLLGICVGMQMLFERGLEHGEHQGLGWLKGDVTQLTTHNSQLKVPHMGWNELAVKCAHPLLRGIKNGDHAYFVHSYYAKTPAENIIATTDYGVEIPAIVGQGNIMGTQFHPEKSQASGLAILQNFLRMSL